MKKLLSQAVLCFLLAAGLSPGFFWGSTQEDQADPLTVQIQEAGKVRIFDGQKEIGDFQPQIFLKGWNIVFFQAPGPGEKADAVAMLPDGSKVLYKVSVKAGPSGLKVHGVMTPLKDIQVLSGRVTGYFMPYRDWDGDTYDLGRRRAALPHEVVTSDGGVIAHDTAPLVLGPSHANGLTMKFTSKLPVTLQDVRQWTPGVSVFFTNDKPGGQVWDWKVGEKRAFDFTLAFNRPFVVKAVTPPKDLEVLRAQMDQLVKPYIDGGWCPGFAVGVLYKGKKWVGGYGTTSLAGGKTPDGDTEYEIGSITKLFTKLLFSDMVHQGKMGLDDKAQAYLPKGVTMPSKDGKDITLLMLSNHTSQLPHDPDDVSWGNPANNGAGNYSLDRLYAYLNRYKLTADPGGAFQYSNTGVALLGNFVAQKKGISWADYLQQRVLDPVGLKDTGVTWTADELSRVAQGHASDMDTIPLWKWDKSVFMPAGALHSTVNDLLKLANASLDGKGPLSDIAFDDTAQKLDWGARVAHEGGTGGFNTSFFVDRTQKAVVVILGNIGDGVTGEVAYKIQQLLKGYLLAGAGLPVFTQLPASELQQYTGTYHVVKTPKGWPMPKEDDTLFLKDGGLVAKANKDWNLDIKIEPLANGDFYDRPQRAEISFTKDGQGTVTGFTLPLYPDYVAEKVGYQAPKAKIDDGIPPPP